MEQAETGGPYELPEGWENRHNYSFDELARLIGTVHHDSYDSAVKAVNRIATIRNLQAEAFPESDLEDALILHLQEFLLELGKGFCFEARQKRMIIDDEHCFADLVFYNRILHCNVIIELKDDEFRHADLSQLNAYARKPEPMTLLRCDLRKGLRSKLEAHQ